MPSNSQPSNDKIENVRLALEDYRFKWRTIEGVAQQTQLPVPQVLEAIRALISDGVVIRSGIPSADGRDLYATRVHYKRFSTFGDRIAAAFRNRAD